MAADLFGKRVLVLSDNNGLSRAIELTLMGPMEVVRLVSNSALQKEGRIEAGDFDLIVVAMSSPASDPSAELSKLSLAGRAKSAPVLIISDGLDCLAPNDGPIHHLDFPFDIDAFCDQVKRILRGEMFNLEESSFALKDANLKPPKGYSQGVRPVEYGRQAEYWVG